MEGLEVNTTFWRDRPTLVTGATGLRIAYSRTYGYARPNADVVALIDTVAKAFETLGCIVESVEAMARCGREGNRARAASSASAEYPWWATKCIISPSNRYTEAMSAPHRRHALAAMALKIGVTSVGERLITRRMSLVAVC